MCSSEKTEEGKGRVIKAFYRLIFYKRNKEDQKTDHFSWILKHTNYYSLFSYVRDPLWMGHFIRNPKNEFVH